MTSEAKLRKALEDLEKVKESQKKKGEEMVAAKVAWEEELAKVKTENLELKGQLQDIQASFQTLQRDFAAVSGKVFGLEAEIKVAKEQHREVAAQETFIREASIWEVEEQVMENFKRSEEYATS